jgi:hypothetical protein
MSEYGRKNGMQARVKVLLEEGKTVKEISLALGISKPTVHTHKKRIEKKIAAEALCPVETPGIDTTHATVQYKRFEDGTIKPVNWWARQRPSEMLVLEAIVQGLCTDVKGLGKVKARKPKKSETDDVLSEIDIFDPHVGMYAAEAYTRESDYDCSIAAREMVKAVHYIAGRFNKPGKIVLVLGGDVLHTDSRTNKTEKSGNMLDVDTRFQRVVQYAILAATECVDIAADVGTHVHIVVTPGNHDWHSCIWLSQVLDAYYKGSKNVTVEMEQSPRKRMIFGDNLLIWTHGDGVRPAKWPMIIASEFSEEWGKTKYRYLKMGHFHHKKTIAPVTVHEQPGLSVEYLAALCPTDAWHAEAGYVGTQRGASGFEYHKKAGQISPI